MKIFYTFITRVVMVVVWCMVLTSTQANINGLYMGNPFGEPAKVFDSTRYHILMEEFLLEYASDQTRYGDGWPPIWDIPDHMQAFHGFIITLDANPRINDYEIEKNDFIGGFYTDDNGELKCGGATLWLDTISVGFSLFKDNSKTPEKDGFDEGETIYFKFFSWDNMKDYDVDIVNYIETPPYSYDNKYHELSLSKVNNMQAQVDLDFYIYTNVNPVCIGDQIILSCEEFVGTGGPYTYSWTSDPAGFLSDLQTPLPTLITETTTYFLSVEDGLFTSGHELTVDVNEFPEAYAGPDGSVCGNETFSLNGSAIYNDGIMWTSSGDGFFDDPTSLNANYAPGTTDNQNGSVNITLIANPLFPCSESISDELQLQVFSLPAVYAGEDRSACGNDAIILEANAQFYSSIEWTSSGDGVFSNPTESISYYTPGPDDINDGVVTIEVCAEGISPCAGTVCSEFSISFLVGPSCNGPSSRTKCENVPVPLVGIASNNEGTLWTTQGDGYFVNPAVINTQYIGGLQDRDNGGTIVTLNAFPISPCTTIATKNVTIILKPLPDVYAGEDISVVDFDSIILTATVSNYTTTLWQTDGDGQFTCPNATITQYMPGNNDILTGSTVITVAAGAILPCSGTVSDEIMLYYEEVATVYAGDDISICKDDEVYLEGTASNYQSTEWSTLGDGSFLDINDLATTYIPGNNDIASGELNLTLSAIPIPPETEIVNDQLLLTIHKDAIVTACNDQLICESQNVQLSATANNYGSIEWTSNGDGVFSNSNILSPTYFPGDFDKQNGDVELTVSVSSMQPCTYIANDLVSISIAKNPVLSAGIDAVICETSMLALSGQVQYAQEFFWQSSGDGYFDNPQNLQTNYHPGSQDIETGIVELTLSGEAITPCLGFVNDNLSLVINKLPVVSAGSDHSICETANVELNGTASKYSSLSWISSGDGNFTHPDELVTYYNPGSLDKENEYVSVTLVASPLSPCTISKEDDAEILISRMPFSNAGNNTTICEGEVVDLNGEALNYTSLDWSTSGDGYFDGKSTLNTTYTPGPGDINNGYVTLCLIATSSGVCPPYTDCITATIVSLPETFAGNNNTVTYGFSYAIEEAVVKNAGSFKWTSPNGAGSFDNDTIINPVYTPGFDDLITKTIIIELTAQPISPCLLASSHSFELSVSSDCQDAFVNAGADMVICTTSSADLSASSASNYASVEWTSTGDGIFSDPNTLNPVYTPGTNDLLVGTADLCLTAYASDICQDASDCFILTFQQPPTVNAGEDLTVCEGTTVPVDAFGDHYNTIIWTTNGDGTFDNAGELTTIYNPGQGDINNGNVTLCATAVGISGCGDVEDYIQISMQKSPSANAGMDQAICSGSKVFLNGMAENFDAIHWESNGNGSFSNPNLINPTYTPGSQDISNGTVELCLKATGLFNCADLLDCMVVNIHEPPVVFPGLTETVCEEDVMYLNAYAENYQYVVWSTNGGDGNFLNKNALVTEYYPGPGDIDAGGVALCITAIGLADCDDVFDCIINTINKQAIANAGIDQTICSGTNATFTGNAENYTTFDWQTSGDGIFTNPDDLSTDYIPGMQDLDLGQVNICLNASGQQGCNDQNHCITLTIEQPPDVLASNVDVICENGTFQLSATANNYSCVSWQTNGDGNFNNCSILNPIYTPGSNDVNTGQVELCITASALQNCNPDSNCITAIIQKNPIVYAGPDASIEIGEAFTLDSANVENYSTLNWSTSGTGDFNNSVVLNTVYSPSNADYIEGAVILSLSASAINPCTVSVEDEMVLGLSPDCNPFVDAGDDISICEDQLVQLDGFVFNSPLVLWTTSGDGSFNDASLVNPVYTPGPNDLLSENTELCLTAFATGTCEDKSDCLIFTIIRNALASAGNNRTIPMIDSVEMSDAYADNYSQIQWLTLNGTGGFNSENIANPTYIPKPIDYQQDFIIFQMISEPISPCCTYSDDMVEVYFEEECSDAIITLAEEIHSCNTVFTYTIDAEADNFSSLFWTTSGDGSFNHTNTINPEYHCGPNDESLGQVTLSLYAEGFGSCNSTNASTELILHPAPTANAGNDATICGRADYIIQGSASEYESISWTTNGDGTFVNQNGLNPTYIPGDNDMINGSVVLCLEADGYGMHLPDDDCMVLTLVSPPEISAGGNMNICGQQTIQLQATGQNFESVSWQTNGDGSFSNQNSLTATYTPGQNDLTDTLVELCITAHPNDGCDEANDCLIISFQEHAFAYAGDNASVDVGMNYQIDDAIVENEAYISWTTSGTGTFNSSVLQNPIYFPSDVDYNNGPVTLTLTVNPISPCSLIEIDEMSLGFNQVCQDAVAIAGDDIDICITNPIYLSGDAENYSAVKWETQSDGTFENEYERNTIYYPGENDKISGVATLCFTAFAQDVCSDDTDCLTINMYMPPLANAGDDVSVCETTHDIELFGSASNYSSISWSTTGDGTFSDVNTLTPVYHPGAMDIFKGNTSVILTASSDHCDAAEDEIMIYLEHMPFAYAGDDITSCENEIIDLIGLADNYSSLIWTTSGEGSFTDTVSATTSYEPGANDILDGTVELCLNVQAIDQCNNIADCVIITIKSAPTASAGEDNTICETSPFYVLSGQTSFSDTIFWSSDGDGYFDDPQALEPNYYPGSGDKSVGYVNICLTAASNFTCSPAEDCMILTITKGPAINLSSYLEICVDDNPILSAQVEYYDTLLWTTTGDGTFSQPTKAATQYFPGTSDIESGSVELSLTATGNEYCDSEQAVVMLNIQKAPVAHAGGDTTIYIGEVYSLSEASVEYSNTCNWVSDGSGYFDEADSLHCTYYPSQGDYDSTQVTLTLTAIPQDPCSLSSEESMLLAFIVECVDATADAGGDKDVCMDSNVSLNGIATDYSSVLWETDGDGYFIDPQTLSTEYVPGGNDLNSQEVGLCLNAFAAEPCDDAIDCITVIFYDAATANAGDDIDVCKTVPFIQLDGAVSNNVEFYWSTNGTGSFVPTPTTLSPKYFPSYYDTYVGQIEIYLTATHAICGEARDTLTLTFHAVPTVDAGGNASICANETFTTFTASASDEDAVLWETNGDGYFDDTVSIISTYFPGILDQQNGSVVLKLTAYSTGFCNDAEDALIISIEKIPEANAGDDETICETSGFYTLLGEASFQSGSMWNSDGDGTFEEATSLTSKYYPGNADLSSGSVNLCLTSYGISSCGPVEDCMELTFQKTPLSNAGEPMTICENETVQITGTAENFSNILWTTDGDGSFNLANSLTAVYTPGDEDIQFGLVELCLTAYGLSDCVEVIDCVNLYIQANPTVFAGDDFSSCVTAMIPLSGWAKDFDSINWSTSGDGLFADTSELNTSYMPGTLDLFNGTVELCLNGTGLYGCEDAEDCVTVVLIKTPIAYAGEDTTIYQGDVYSTDGAFVENYSQVVWSSSSEGEMGGGFENINDLITTYTPGNADFTNEFVHLYLTAEPISPCEISVVDSMTLSITINCCVDAIADAGEDATICEGQTYMVSGTAYNDSSTMWNTGGDGWFNDASFLQTSYTPGENDYLNGSVELCFTAFAYDTCQDNTDCLTLYFQMPPVVFAGSDNTVPKYEAYYLGDAYTENSGLVLWFTTNGAGDFENATCINATYNPKPMDYFHGVELMVTAYSIDPCQGSVTDVVKISFVQNCVDAEADAGEDIDVCVLNNAVQMNASAANFSSLNWGTNGDGSFNYPNTLNPEYVFGENDKLNGQVILSLEAGSFGLCNPASDDVLINFHEQPVVAVGGDQSICSGETVIVTGSAENYTTFSWTTSGDGTFIDEDTFAPSYTPGNGDIANGGATVCLLANGYGICGPVSDCMFIEITPQPSANAGDDATICETQDYQLVGTAENYSGLNWETNGDGIFDDPSSLTATYTLGENDIASDTVELCLNVIGLNDCGNTSACMTLTIQGQPEVDAGNDATIFNGSSFPLVEASAENYESVFWTTTGTGLFIETDTINPIYFPTYEDFLADSVILTITAFPNDPCSLVVSDEMTLTILEECIDAEAYAGDDFVACIPGEVILNGSAEYEDSVFWESNGDGSFVESNELISGYIPGESDLATGFVEVCLTAYAFGVCQDSTDCVTISFTNAPIVEAGEDLTICEIDGMVSLEAIGQDYSDVGWTTSGDGTFEESTSLTTNYILGFNDLFNGEVTLTITANSNLCPSVSDEIVVTISRSLMLYAGEDASICDDVSYPTSGAFVNNATSTEWTTSGDGNFVDPLQVITEYIPGPDDIVTGEVELCLSALAISPCADNYKCITLTFLPSVSIFAGEDDEICETEVYPLDAEAENYAEILWTTSGDGTFSNQIILNAVYTPGSEDILNGEVSLYVEASSPHGCNSVTDDIVLLIVSKPWVNAGMDTIICAGNSLDLSGEAGNYSAYEWQSSGDGTFENSNSLLSTYTPGSEDISVGQIEICLVAEGMGACTGSQSDCMTLVIDQMPFVDAGELIKICGNQTFQTNPIVENYAGLLWTTNGDGTFDDPTVAQTTYYPGSQDTINTMFQLCLTVSSLGACDSVTDCVTVIVYKHAFADAGPNSSIVQGESFTASFAIARNYSEILWTTIGDGIFVNEHEVTAIYIPGPEDISKQGALLTLSAMPLDPCTSIAIAELFITIFDECEDAFVNAGVDMSICEDQGSVQLSASALDASSHSWSSAGDGVFSDQDILDPEYTLGSNDILNGSVKLYLFGEAYGNCESALDSLLISLIYFPTIVQDIMGQEVLLGGQAMFELETAYAETFEWYGPMGLIANNNLSNLIIENVTYEDSGEYYCVIINSCGTETSANVTLIVYEEQSISIDSGWSGISSWIDPFDASVENIFKDIETQLVTLSNFSGIYYPGYNINTLNNWDSQDGYQVKFSGIADQKFIGVTNTNRIADLSAGWNYLPVLVACPVDIEELFGNMDEVDLIKEIAGNGIYWPDMNINSIGQLQPGNAYLIRVNQQLEVVFAECDAGFKSDVVTSVHRPENMTNWNEINYSPTTHIFAIDNAILDQLNIGDIIGAFTIDGTCAGMSEIMMQNNSLALYGDDQLTSELDGFAENSSIQFKVYRPGTGEEFELNVRFDQSLPNAEGVFVSNGISRILDAQLNATSIIETSTGQINLYPNPTNGDVNISGVKKGSIIDIYTSGGQVLESINVGTNDQNTNILTVDLSAYPGGVIYFRITTKDKVEVRKVILK